MKTIKVITDQELKNISGGFWADALAGLLGDLATTPTPEELNGGRTKNFQAHTCGPYGQGGTPNSCNF